MTCDCNSRYVALDPYVGTQHAVAEAARNVYVTGARPLAISDCLNFGSPEKPEVMWQFSRAIDGMADACRAYEIAVISGNVSFYNDTQGASIPPTPTIAMVGLAADARRTASAALLPDGAEILLLGGGEPELGGSEYLAQRHGKTGDRPPAIDLAAERKLGELVSGLIAGGTLRSAHDVSDGGLAVSLTEMCLLGKTGCRVSVPVTGRTDVALFGESGCRILVSAPADAAAEVEKAAAAAGVSCSRLGTSGGDAVRIETGGKATVDVKLSRIRDAWEATLPAIAHADLPEAARAAAGA
jgi:phosphoribosylformylglycinamidine (FGAM) synthase-like enzyme